jgi:hypothetical protein
MPNMRRVDEVHGTPKIARGAEGIRATMAAYIDLKPHMDVVTHHTTVAGDFAMTRSQWLITGQDKDGKTIVLLRGFSHAASSSRKDRRLHTLDG